MAVTGAELRARRARLGVTQADLAAAVGVTGTTVARWERDEASIPVMLDLALAALESGGASLPTGKRVRTTGRVRDRPTTGL